MGDTFPKCRIIKIQRPALKDPRLLIYSEDGDIPITLIPDEEPFKAALGNRVRAWFKYTVDAGRIILGDEVFRKQ